MPNVINLETKGIMNLSNTNHPQYITIIKYLVVSTITIDMSMVQKKLQKTIKQNDIIHIVEQSLFIMNT